MKAHFLISILAITCSATTTQLFADCDSTQQTDYAACDTAKTSRNDKANAAYDKNHAGFQKTYDDDVKAHKKTYDDGLKTAQDEKYGSLGGDPNNPQNLGTCNAGSGSEITDPEKKGFEDAKAACRSAHLNDDPGYNACICQPTADDKQFWAQEAAIIKDCKGRASSKFDKAQTELQANQSHDDLTSLSKLQLDDGKEDAIKQQALILSDRDWALCTLDAGNKAANCRLKKDCDDHPSNCTSDNCQISLNDCFNAASKAWVSSTMTAQGKLTYDTTICTSTQASQDSTADADYYKKHGDTTADFMERNSNAITDMNRKIDFAYLEYNFNLDEWTCQNGSSDIEAWNAKEKTERAALTKTVNAAIDEYNKDYADAPNKGTETKEYDEKIAGIEKTRSDAKQKDADTLATCKATAQGAYQPEWDKAVKKWNADIAKCVCPSSPTS